MVAARPSDYAMNCVLMKLHNLVNSSVELILGQALFASLSRLYEKWSCWVYSDAEFRSCRDFNEYSYCSIALVPQLEIPDVGRLDFGIFIPGLNEYPLVVVECDGHEFHERTPEQASNDRRKDRALARLGIPVLRFTGTDVVRGSAEVADEITAFLHSQADIEAPYEWPRVRLSSAPLHNIT
jgi:hypothetical protein